MTSNICYSVSESPRRHSRAGFSVANIFQTPVWFREVRPDNDDSRRHASIPHPLRFTGIARRPTPLSSGRFCRAMIRHSRGTLVPEKTRSVLSPKEFFELAILNR